MVGDPIEVMNFAVDPVAGAQALFLRFDLVDKAEGPRQRSGEYMTLMVVRAEAEQLLEQLQRVLNPPARPSGLN